MREKETALVCGRWRLLLLLHLDHHHLIHSTTTTTTNIFPQAISHSNVACYWFTSFAAADNVVTTKTKRRHSENISISPLVGCYLSRWTYYSLRKGERKRERVLTKQRQVKDKTQTDRQTKEWKHTPHIVSQVKGI